MAAIENSTFETDLDNHAVWYNCTITRSAAAAHSGSYSMLVTQSDDFVGVQLDNYPYHAGVVAGSSYDFSVWYREASATMPTVTWRIVWHDNAGNQVGSTTDISLSRSTTWAKASATITAPTGAQRVSWAFSTATGNGSAWYVDDVLVEDAVVASSSLPLQHPARRLLPILAR